MKKKILLAVCIIAMLTIVLVGCVSKPPHKTFSDPWSDSETITYDVTRTLKDKTQIKGTSTFVTQRLNDSEVTVGTRKYEHFSGTFVSIETKLDDGSVMEAQVAFKSSFEPVASYKKIEVKGYVGNSPAKDTKQITELFYEDEKCKYSTDFDGTKKSGEIKTGKWIKKPFYDNLMIYHIARSSYIGDNFNALSASVFSTSKYEMKNLSVNRTAINLASKIFGEDDEKEVKVDIVAIALNATYSGAPMYVTLSKEKLEDYRGMNLNTERIPMIIVEADMEYKISSYISA